MLFVMMFMFPWAPNIPDYVKHFVAVPQSGPGCHLDRISRDMKEKYGEKYAAQVYTVEGGGNQGT